MIYTRIDTYSVILYNVSIRQVLEHFDLPINNLDEIFKNNYKKRDCKIGDTYVWTYNGLRFETKFDEYIDKNDQDGNTIIFDVVFSWLRLYISGEGIDYLENVHSDVLGYNLSVMLCSPDFYSPICEYYKITRCDFAFDFVNYIGNEFERLRKILLNAEFDEKLSKGGRLYNSTPGGIGFSVRSGKEKTIYLGSSSADRMLRIYDKKYQLCPDGVWDTVKIPKKIIDEEITIESWYRVELQCRDDFAFRYMMSCGGDFRYIMGEIRAHFDVRTSDGKKLAPLHKIFLWADRTPIVQNANSFSPKTELQVAESYVEHIALRQVRLIAHNKSPDEFYMWLNGCVYRQSQLRTDKRNALSAKFNTSLMNVIEQEGEKLDSFGNLPHMYKSDDGFWYLRVSSDKDFINNKGYYSSGDYNE